MIDAPATLDDAVPSRRRLARDAHGWLHTAELALVFLVLALLADLVGLAHEGTATREVGRGPSPSARPVSGAAQTRGRVIAVAARPATLR